jgi:hypothetical protein
MADKVRVAIALFVALIAYTGSQSSYAQPAAAARDSASRDADRSRLHVLFLGNDGANQSHDPVARINELIPYLSRQGILVTYTDDQNELNLERLEHFDVLMQYGNRNVLEKDQELALLAFVQGGGGFVAVHSASASFLNSDAFVNRPVSIHLLRRLG